MKLADINERLIENKLEQKIRQTNAMKNDAWIIETTAVNFAQCALISEVSQELDFLPKLL